jgi:hypothetical protein
MLRGLALGLTVAIALPAAAQPVRDVVASPPVDRSVTIYRAPGRNGGQLALANLRGFAVITETREVDLPQGQARLSFTGVADGIVPESALVSGLPGGVIEKNRDDALLSPSALMRASVGREVALRRTDRKTGKTTVTPVRIVSASDQGVVFASASGNEALRCDGLPESFQYSGAGEGLHAQPTLSVLTRSTRAIHARIRLTYIAENFDWNANYIARIGADGKTLDLTGWITLANGNGVTLSDAQTQIVAGGLNRAYVRQYLNAPPRVIARCWPMATTSDIPEKPGRPYQLVHPWLNDDTASEDIIVTSQRRKADYLVAPARMMAAPAPPPPPPPPEQLGDLKLYRLGERTTIAARQMKQTRLIAQAAVPFDIRYRAEVQVAPWMTAAAPQPAQIRMRTTNDTAHHLGLPLPAGAMLIEQDQAGKVMLLGEPALGDTAKDEKLDLVVGLAQDITCGWTRKPAAGQGRTSNLVVTVTNGSGHAAAIEVRLNAFGGWSVAQAPMIDGVPTLTLSLASGERREINVGLVRD